MKNGIVHYTHGEFADLEPNDVFPDFDGYALGGLEECGFRIPLEAAGYQVVLEFEAGNGLNVAEACVYIHNCMSDFSPILDFECVVELWLRSGGWQRAIFCDSMQDGLEVLGKYHFFEILNALNNVDVRDAVHQWRENAPNRRLEAYNRLTEKEKLDDSRKAQAKLIKRLSAVRNAIKRRHDWIKAKEEEAPATAEK